MSATWTDLDGDLATLAANKPILAESEFAFLTQAAGDAGFQLAQLDLHDVAAAKGVNLTFTASRDKVHHLGDGLVNVGRIEATGLDLGAISISGDLAAISAGDATLSMAAVTKLTAGSGGAYGLATQGSTINSVSTNNEWVFTGHTGAIVVKGNFLSSVAVLDTTAGLNYNALASLTSVTIGGNLVGGSDALRGSDGIGSGNLFTEGAMGAVKVGGSILGGTVAYGGSITSAGGIASVTVGGNIVGGIASHTGLIISSGPLGAVSVAGSLVGGNSTYDSTGTATTLIDHSGVIGSTYYNVGAVKIGGDVVPGLGDFCGAIYTAPASGTNIASVTIGGTLYGFRTLSTGANTTEHVTNGIYADGELGPVKIGEVSGKSPAQPAQIVAHGKAAPVIAADAQAIASVTISRSAYALEILAGYNSSGTADNPAVQIGAVKIGLDFAGSSIAAGIDRMGNGFGDPTNTVATAGTGYTNTHNVFSTIASITVGGAINGNPLQSANFDTGIVAQEIGALKVGGTVFERPPGALEVLSVGVTPGFLIREI